MRIFSKFHDYYDSLQAGGDRSLLFLRDQKEIKDIGISPKILETLDLRFDYFREITRRNIADQLEMRFFTILFCGKLYPGIRISYNDTSGKDSSGYAIVEQISFCYSVEDVDKVLDRILKEEALKYYHSTKSNPALKWKRWGYHRGLPKKTDLLKYFNGVSKIDLKEFCIKNQIAIGVFSSALYNRDIVFTLNPCLKEYQFYRVLDVQTTFQELEMWLGGIAVPQKPMPVISDELKIETHGFDLKHSFRKEKR